jgi:hypothetical protein
MNIVKIAGVTDAYAINYAQSFIEKSIAKGATLKTRDNDSLASYLTAAASVARDYQTINARARTTMTNARTTAPTSRAYTVPSGQYNNVSRNVSSEQNAFNCTDTDLDTLKNNNDQCFKCGKTGHQH